MPNVANIAEVIRLRSRAWQLGQGPAKVSAMEEVVAAADDLGEEHLSFRSRLDFIEAATFAGQIEKAFPAFVWCLSQCDQKPGVFPVELMLWQYKWMANKLPRFASVSAAKIEETLVDLSLRFETHGMGLRACHQIRMEVAMQMGCAEQAAEAFAKWQATSRDDGADCPACERDRLVDYHTFRHEYAQAIKKAGPILNGKLFCAEIPHNTLGRLLIPMLERGEHELAETTAKRGYRLVRNNGDFAEALGQHLEYCAITGNLRLATSMIERHLARALTAFAEWDRLVFLRPTMLAFIAMTRKSPKKRKLRMPPEFPLRNKAGEYAPEELLAWARPEVDRLSSMLDARNGNAYYSKLIGQAIERIDRLGQS